MWVHAWVYVYFPYGCSRSPLNKTVVPLLSKPTSFVSNEHLPGSLPTTAGFSVSPCQQPMTLIRCFITPKRCVCGREKVRKLVRKCGWVCVLLRLSSCVWQREKCILDRRGSGVHVFVRGSHNEAAPRWRYLAFLPEGLLGKEQRRSRVTLFALDNLSAQRTTLPPRVMTVIKMDSNTDRGLRVCFPSNVLPAFLSLFEVGIRAKKKKIQLAFFSSIKWNRHPFHGAPAARTFLQVT